MFFFKKKKKKSIPILGYVSDGVYQQGTALGIDYLVRNKGGIMTGRGIRNSENSNINGSINGRAVTGQGIQCPTWKPMFQSPPLSNSHQDRGDDRRCDDFRMPFEFPLDGNLSSGNS